MAGCVALVTCHRSELYLTGHDADSVKEAVVSYFQSDDYRKSVVRVDRTLRPVSPLRELRGADTVRHLFRVASGLDSVLVGETEVLGQVRAALRTSMENGTTDTHLQRLFEAAIEAGRRVRAETELGSGRRSLGAVVWRALEPRLAGERGRVILVGAGQAAASIAEAIPATIRPSLAIFNRGETRGQALAERIGVPFQPLDELAGALDQADACVLAAPVSLPRSVTSGSGNVLVLDVCQPPNLPAPAPEAGFEYWNLARILEHGQAGDESTVAATRSADAIIDEAVRTFESVQQERHTAAGRLLRMLHAEGERIARRELETALRRLPELDSRELAVLEDFARSVREKLLLRPTLALRRSLDAGRPDAAREIFDLFSDQDQEPASPRQRRDGR